MRDHIIQIFISTLVTLLVFALFNWVVDPYKIWNPPLIQGVNTVKPALDSHERIYKAVGLARHHADMIILGTSRSDIGLNPNHPALGSYAVNLSTLGQRYPETRRFFDLKADSRNPMTFIIGLDFFLTNYDLLERTDPVGENFTSYRNPQLLFSLFTSIDSVRSIGKESEYLNKPEVEKGIRFRPIDYVNSMGGNRKMFRGTELELLLNSYSPRPICEFDFAKRDKYFPQLNEIRDILSRAYREHINLKLFISPAHARQWEAHAIAGQWYKWEEWKRRLVIMNEDEAKRAGVSAFPLWDFSGYNTITMETVPAYGDTKTIMRWYFESSHYTTATGDLILDRIFNFKSPVRTIPNDFGILLTSSNVDSHLANIRISREQYRFTHPLDIAEIESEAVESAKINHCNFISR